jgi:hypothetical protein
MDAQEEQGLYIRPSAEAGVIQHVVRGNNSARRFKQIQRTRQLFSTEPCISYALGIEPKSTQFEILAFFCAFHGVASKFPQGRHLCKGCIVKSLRVVSKCF